MEQFFKDFEAKLQATEEKLDILSEWHIAKGYTGATEIAEECRTAITELWINFYGLSETYKQREASHEAFYQANVETMINELRQQDEREATVNRFLDRKRPNYLLFDLLAKEMETFRTEDQGDVSSFSIWYYLRRLVKEDLKARGVI